MNLTPPTSDVSYFTGGAAGRRRSRRRAQPDPSLRRANGCSYKLCTIDPGGARKKEEERRRKLIDGHSLCSFSALGQMKSYECQSVIYGTRLPHCERGGGGGRKFKENSL